MIRIFVPYDFSSTATHALNFATSLATTYSKIDITVFHVVEIPVAAGMTALGGGLDPVPDFESQLFFKELIEARKKQLKELELHYSTGDFSLNTSLILGNAYRGIADAINEGKPDLVVMGSKGASGLDEVLIGSNTEKIVRTSPCPVITIKGETDAQQMKKVVFASDFRDSAVDVANRIKRIQHLFDAQFYFVVVNTPGNFETTRDSMARIRTFVKHHNFENIKAEVYNSLSEESGILEFADDIDADLIAMTTHGRTGLLHLITGSIAEDVVNHSKRPVWTFKIN
jgi:nucleotide-binding universal stress UspA family protein